MPPARAARLGRLASWLGRHPAAGLAGLPVVVFGLPAAAGRLLIGDDNLVQNFPLRVLVGWDLRHLRPPLWDPYIWAGTPLLAGFNAGAAYPATWLFALVPSRAAFFVNQALVFSLAAVGVWRLLRDYSCSQLAAVLGGASFAWGGFVSAQLVHLDLAEAASLLPWALVGLRRFATRPPGRRALGWLALTTAAFGLILLSGAPEAASCAGVTVAVYTLSLAWEHRDRWASTLAGGAGALAGALALGAVQVVPGLAFASHSQRATASYVFFTGGSLPPELAILAVLPYLLGGYGRLGVPEYFGQYNLAEVTSYVGVLPLLAALALLVPTLRRRPESRPWRAWYLVGAVGALMALGGHTPLGPVLFHVPLLGSQRLQSRNLLALDLALCMLAGFFVDRLAGGAPAVRSRPQAALVALPAGVALASWVLFVGWGPGFVRALGAVQSLSSLTHPMIPWLSLAVALVVGATALVLGWARVPAGCRVRVLAGLVAADLAFFTLYQSWLAPAPPQVVGASDPIGNALAAQLAAHPGRFVIYDPRLQDYPGLLRAGQPDLNILRGTRSAQGYGSIVRASYQVATGAHDQDSLYPQVVSGDTLDLLDVSVLVTRPLYLVTPLSPPPPGQAVPPPSVTTTVPGGPPPARPPGPLGPGQQRTWYFGSPLVVTGVRLAARPSPAALRVGLLDGSGRLRWPVARLGQGAGGALSARFASPQVAVGLVAENQAGVPLELAAPTVTTWEQGRLTLQGDLQDELKPPHWRYAGTLDTSNFSVFVNTRARGGFWTSPAGSARLLEAGPADQQAYSVSSPVPTTLVRSVAYDPDWQATVSGDGRSSTSRVAHHGPVQAVAVPAGTHTVAFSYHPEGVVPGALVSAVAWASLAAFGLAWAVSRRGRGRPAPGSGGHPGAGPQGPDPSPAREQK